MERNDSANLPSPGGSETVDPSTDINNPENWDFADSDDDDQNNPAPLQDGIESETDEAAETADQETDEPAEEQAEDAPAEEEQPVDEAKLDEALVTLKGGEQVPVKELKLGYMRERDYRIKTQDISNKGRTLHEMSERVTTTANALAQFLVNQMPQEPSPALAMQDPQEFVRQKAMFDAASQRVGQILEMAGQPKQVAQQLTQEQHASLLQEESAKLAQAFPETSDPVKREAFFETAFETARHIGFSDQELQGATDHRLFALAHYARLGMQAEQAKKKAMVKVNNAPPPVARGRAQSGNAQQARKQQDAVARLNKTGSLQDALKIDWD